MPVGQLVIDTLPFIENILEFPLRVYGPKLAGEESTAGVFTDTLPIFTGVYGVFVFVVFVVVVVAPLIRAENPERNADTTSDDLKYVSSLRFTVLEVAPTIAPETRTSRETRGIGWFHVVLIFMRVIVPVPFTPTTFVASNAFRSVELYGELLYVFAHHLKRVILLGFCEEVVRQT